MPLLPRRLLVTWRPGLTQSVIYNRLCLSWGRCLELQSIQEQQYFAHPRNQFWSIMARIAEFEVGSSYRHRVSCLAQRGIMLWDVVHSAYREGSLDSNIKSSGLEVKSVFRFVGFELYKIDRFQWGRRGKVFCKICSPRCFTGRGRSEYASRID